MEDGQSTRKQMEWRDALVYVLAKVMLEDSNVDFFLNQKTLGPDTLEKLRHHLMILVFFKPDSDTNPQLFAHMEYAFRKWWRVWERIEHLYKERDLRLHYNEIHSNPQKERNSKRWRYSRNQKMNRGRRSNKQIIEDAQCSIANHITKSRNFEEEVLQEVPKLIELFNNFIKNEIKRSTSYQTIKKREPLKFRLNQLCNEGSLALFAETVLEELPIEALSMPRYEWDSLVEWVFTCEAAKHLALLMEGWERRVDLIDRYAYVEIRFLQYGCNTENIHSFEHVFSFLKLVEWFESYTLLGRSKEDGTVSQRALPTPSNTSILHTHYRELPTFSDDKKQIIDFLYYETVRVARETTVRKKEMLSVTMALHTRLGSESLIHALSAELFNMIFCML